jgi:hypothetical protein
MQAAGRDWDAIRVPIHLARRTLEAASVESGAVLWDTWGGCMYWLVPVGTAVTWDVPHTRSCGDAHYVAIPSAGHRSGPGLHWLIPPVGERVLTDPMVLRAALRTTIAEVLGPREVAS